MKRARIILLYFVMPIFGFAAYVVSQVGFEHVNFAVWFTAMIVIAILFAINTRSDDDGYDDDIRKPDTEWETYYTIQQSERLHRQHHD